MLLAPDRTACELDDESDEKAEIRRLIFLFDRLYEACQIRKLTHEEIEQLNDLYGYLQVKEEEFWRDSQEEHFWKDSYVWIGYTISDRLGIEFPGVRYELGLPFNN